MAQSSGMYSTTQANLRKARQRNPILSVSLSNNPNRIFSISVPPSKQWTEFMEKVKCQFEMDSKMDISRLAVYQMDATERRIVDISDNDMSSIAHKTQLEIVIQNESDNGSDNDSSSESSIIESDSNDSDRKSDNDDTDNDDDNDGIAMDLFGRFNRVIKMKSSKKKGVNRPMHHWRNSDSFGFDPKQIWRDLKRRKLKATQPNSEIITLTDPQSNISLQTRSMVWPLKYRDKKDEFEVTLDEIKQTWKWAIILCHGGRFAGAIYDGTTMVKHKTFARYTTRKKQGKRQVNYMATGGGAKSAGAHKRMHMEKKLLEEIQGILTKWYDDLQACQTIFINAPGPYNTMTLFGKAEEQSWLYPSLNDGRLNIQLSNDRLKQITKSDQSVNVYRLYKKDRRIQKIPISTHKVTLDEIANVHRYLSTCWLHVPSTTPANGDSNDSQ